MSVSIVIPAYNEGETIISCLQSCVDQSVPAKEIIVVNNKSKDDTLKKVKDFKRDYEKGNSKRKGQIIILEQNEVQGLIPTRNMGLDAATGDILGRIDADAILIPTWVESLIKVYQDKSVQGSTGPVTYYDMPLRRFGYRQDNTIRKFVQRRSKVVPMMFGTNMAFRKSAYLAIGREFCLDREDVLHEDIDISIHFAKHHYKVVYIEGMVAGMSARRIEDNFKDFKAYQQRMITTFEKHDMAPTSGAKLSRIVFLLLWFPLHTMRKPYIKRYKKRLSHDILANFWAIDGKMAPFGSRAKLYINKRFRKKK